MNSIEFKTCFDRFGDDLSEVILSYLSIKEKLHFESLSKQIQSVIYNNQKILVISSNAYYDHKNQKNLLLFTEIRLKSGRHKKLTDVLTVLVKKCRYLRQIRLSGQTIEWISFGRCLEKWCHYLDTIHLKKCDLLDTSPRADIFGHKLSKTITELSLESTLWKSTPLSEGCKQLSPYCVDSITYSTHIQDQMLERLLLSLPSLERFHYFAEPERGFVWHNYLKLFTTSSHLYLKRLTQMNISYGIPYKTILEFSRKYCKQIKTLYVTLNTSDYDSYTNGLNKCLEVISSLESLEVLSLTIKHFKKGNSYLIDFGLKQMSQKLTKLSKFEFYLFITETKLLFSTTKLLDISLQFKSLTKFKIKNLNINSLAIDESEAIPLEEGTIGSFERCPALNQMMSNLELQLSNLKDIHLKSIDLCFPNLNSIILSSDQLFRDRCLKYLSKLSQLRHLELIAFNCKLNPITDSGIKKVMKNCPQIHEIILKINTNITEKSLKRFIRLANKRPKVLFELIFVTKNKLSNDSVIYSQNNNYLIKNITQDFHNKYYLF